MSIVGNNGSRLSTTTTATAVGVSSAANAVISTATEYQTLFWTPMLFQTSKNAELLIEEMLDMINDFHDQEDSFDRHLQRKSIVLSSNRQNGHKRRQQILGELTNSEVSNTRVDVVLKSEDTKYNLLLVLKRHFLFSQLRDNELEDVIDVMHALYVEEDTVIIREGEKGESFYILEEGRSEITIAGESLGTLDAGSSFGDLALMYNCPRAATIRSLTACTLWMLDREFFRKAMVTSSSNQNGQLSQFLSKIVLFESIGAQKLNQLARSLTKQSYEDGSYIIKQGEIGDQFYVIYKGTVSVSMTDDSGNTKFLTELGEGEVFGERALIKKEPRNANIVAKGPVECYYLESHDFYSMLGEFVEKFNKINEFRIFRSTAVLTKVSDSRLKTLTSKFTYHRMFSGQRIVCGQGDIFIILEGQFKGTDDGMLYSSEASEGMIEIGNLIRTADEVAGALSVVSDEGLLAVFSKDLLIQHMVLYEEEDRQRARKSQFFDGTTHLRSSMIGSMIDLNDNGINGGSGVEGEREIRKNNMRRQETAMSRRISVQAYECKDLNELSVVCPVGKGTFGSVYLCKYKNKYGYSHGDDDYDDNDGRYIAVKCLDKHALVESKQHHYVRREVIALETFFHPFIASYYGTVITSRKICLLLEYIPGGELWSYLYNILDDKDRSKHGGMVQHVAAIYASIVILALEHIHHLGYSYRDLKPENLLIDQDGYLKVVDFGFAKQIPYINNSNSVQYHTFTLCGTPDYMAPELVLTQGHDKSIDYWAYGILLYELLVGHTPFESSNQQRTFEKIVHSQKHLQFPSSFDSHARSLIRKLLTPNPSLRLGALQNGINEIKNHAFFTMYNINYEDILERKLKMPYVPPTFSISNMGGTLSSSNSSNNHIEQLDLEFERNVIVDNQYDEYFNDLGNPELLLVQ